jgi:cholinesterase
VLIYRSQPVLIGINDDETGIGGSLKSFLGGKLTSGPQAQAAIEVAVNCPSVRAIEARTKQNLPAWRFRVMAAYPNTGKAATHGSELALVFGTMDTGRPNQPKSSDDELKLSKNIRTAWAAFVKDPKEGLIKLGWPVFQANKPTLALLGENNKPTTTFVDPGKYDSVCDAYWNV